MISAFALIISVYCIAQLFWQDKLARCQFPNRWFLFQQLISVGAILVIILALLAILAMGGEFGRIVP